MGLLFSLVRKIDTEEPSYCRAREFDVEAQDGRGRGGNLYQYLFHL